MLVLGAAILFGRSPTSEDSSRAENGEVARSKSAGGDVSEDPVELPLIILLFRGAREADEMSFLGAVKTGDVGFTTQTAVIDESESSLLVSWVDFDLSSSILAIACNDSKVLSGFEGGCERDVSILFDTAFLVVALV